MSPSFVHMYVLLQLITRIPSTIFGMVLFVHKYMLLYVSLAKTNEKDDIQQINFRF